MLLLKPTLFIPNVTDISLNLFKKMDIEAIILDIDDTLVPPKENEINEEILNWTYIIKSSNIKIILVSNNFKKRVGKIAQKLDLPYIYWGMKPLTTGINRAVKILDVSKEKIAVIGDQIFTDVLGANLAGVKSILINPLTPGKSITLKLKRFMEKPIRKKFQKQG